MKEGRPESPQPEEGGGEKRKIVEGTVGDYLERKQLKAEITQADGKMFPLMEALREAQENDDAEAYNEIRPKFEAAQEEWGEAQRAYFKHLESMTRQLADVYQALAEKFGEEKEEK